MTSTRASRRRTFGRLSPGALSIALASLLLLALALPATAQAGDHDTAYSHLGEFSLEGPWEGGLNEPGPGRIAVHEQSGKIFAADTENDRIQVFAPTATDADLDFLIEETAFEDPVGAAIDQVTGELYVTNAGASGGVVKLVPDDASDPSSYSVDQTFTPSEPSSFGQHGSLGSTTARGGIAVDNSGGPGQGDLLLADPGGDVWRIDPSDGSVITSGSFDGDDIPDDEGPFSQPLDVAVDAAGEILVADLHDSAVRLERFDAGGEYQASLPVPATHEEWSASVGVSPATGEVFLAYKEPGDALEVPGRIAQFESDDLVRTFGAPDDAFGLNVNGLALKGASEPERLYAVAMDGPAAGQFDGHPAVQVFEAVLIDPPTCEIEPPMPGDDPTTEWIFKGTVNPGGGETSWTFRYRPVGATEWQQKPDPPESAGDGIVDVTVGPVTVGGLAPNTDYEVELEAENSVDDCEDPEAFTTERAAPFVETSDATSVSATRATLVGEIDPRNSEAEYWFEYSIGGGSVQQVPATPGEIASDAGLTEVWFDLTGLEPESSITYRLAARLLADPDLATEGDPVSFQTRPAADSTFPERGFELVSPLFTNAVGAEPFMVSTDGERALTRYPMPLEDSENMGFENRVSERQSDGTWQNLPFKAGAPITTDTSQLNAFSNPVLNRTLTHAAFNARGSFDPDDQNDRSDLYLRDLETGGIEWASVDEDLPSTEPIPSNVDVYHVSADGRHVLFGSNRPLASTDPTGSGTRTLYEWRGGEVRQIAFRPGESVGPDQETVLGSGLGHNCCNSGELRNAVSTDGERIVFTINTGTHTPGELYLNDGGEIVEIEAGAGLVTFWGADTELSTVVYTHGGELRAFDVETETSGVVNPPLNGEVVRRALHVSDDGNRIYFATHEVGAGSLTSDPQTIWLAERLDSDSAYQAERVVEGVIPGMPGMNSTQIAWDVQVTARQYSADSDGEILAFRSRTELVPGRKTADAPQVYLFERHGKRLYCASCPADGSEPVFGQASLQEVGQDFTGPQRASSGFFNQSNPPPRVVSEEGTVIFTTRTALTEDDVDENWDVYEWRGGEVSLVSSGFGGRPDVITEMSADAETIVFGSQMDLVPGLPEQSVPRAYAARRGGGHPAPPPAPARCRGEECRDEPSGPPALPEQRASDAPSPADPAAPAVERCRAIARRLVAVRGLARRQITSYARQVRALRQGRAVAPRRVIATRRAALRSINQARRLNRMLAECRRAVR